MSSSAYFHIVYKLGEGDSPSQPEHDAEAAKLCAEHLGALFTLLKLLDVEGGWTDEDILAGRRSSLTDALSNIGELGEKIADGLYANVCELGDAYRKAATLAENATTLLDDAANVEAGPWKRGAE